MNAFCDSTVWQSLGPRSRAQVSAAVTRSTVTLRCYRLFGPVTLDDVCAFAQRNLLRGFLQRPAQVVTSVTGRPDRDGTIVLSVGLVPHPVNVRLPAWGCGLEAAIRLTFGDAAPITPPDAGHQEAW